MGKSKGVKRAEHALARNKAMLNAAGSRGLASDKTLRSRGFDADPKGGYTAPAQRAEPEPSKPRRKRKRK